MLRVVVIAVALLLAPGALRAHPEIEAALERLNPLIAASPQDPALYLERGQVYARHADWTLAEANYLRAAELAPDFPRLDRARAVVELATDRAADARVRLDRALRAAPDDVEALVLRARAHVALGSRHAALADLDAAVPLLEAPSPELLLERAALHPDPAAALRSLDAAIAQIGPALPLQLRALELEQQLGRTDAALARLDTLAAQSERKETWLKRRGDVLARAGRTADARLAYRAALAEIATLPEWLRRSPDVARLTLELNRLAAPTS